MVVAMAVMSVCATSRFQEKKEQRTHKTVKAIRQSRPESGLDCLMYAKFEGIDGRDTSMISHLFGLHGGRHGRDECLRRRVRSLPRASSQYIKQTLVCQQRVWTHARMSRSGHMLMLTRQHKA